MHKLARVLTVAHPMRRRRKPQGIVAPDAEVSLVATRGLSEELLGLAESTACFLARLKDYDVFCDETHAGPPPTPEHFLLYCLNIHCHQ